MRTLCDKKVEYMSKVKVKVTLKKTLCVISFEPEVLEISGWLQNVSNEKPISRTIPSPHDVRRTVHLYLRHVTSNKTHDF